ncbi:N-acetyltransferase family protein [Bacillus cytotoxicus]|uniref:GNAT family N-acetyltransferase n=1 Tax=Bacillus cereus group TaxID=86661 RepID=UPI000863FE9F|nr:MULTISPECIES: GNAT family N-acetyltransferase [Bacillus cereus group]AWC28427.1 GNAT family N-acetyltransferase [Bacillus cytotoxicus]AWC40188.1 GNAT family N-acetyltransferase [Bacillus cytotoxicus]AWC48119.1 GNAT family N-acetyltransferase [Bacillus cytotoxicus]AWC52494.1 GNAT family N-acetyltransferase [Bacillus cytotoxicus]AWC56627.1 GNAT family N-acetyltransferase [Bacillus cytotoxicus]
MQIKIRIARKEDIPSIAKVHVDSWRTTYSGLLPKEILENMTYRRREKQWENIFKQNISKQYRYVAETTDGEIVGFIDGGGERTGNYSCDGELYAVYLIKEYQGYKIGQRLFQMMISEFIKYDIHSVLVWVVSNNPSKLFYEKFEPERVDTKMIEKWGVEETAYCWRDIRDLYENLTLL